MSEPEPSPSPAVTHPIRVLQVIPSIDPGDGGPSVAAGRIHAALGRLGIDSVLACTGVDAIEVGAGVRVFSRQTRFYKTSRPLLRWLRAELASFDVVHVHALFSFAPNAAAWLARRRGVPYVVRPLGVLNQWGMANRRRWLKRMSLRFIEGPLLRDAAAVHFTSQAEADEAAALGIAMRSVVIPLGVEVPERGDSALLQGRFPQLCTGRVLLFLSRIDPKKNLEALIDALVELAPTHTDCRLLVCGAGDAAYVQTLKARAKAGDIADRVVWAGDLRGADKASAMAIADVFVLPSHSENFGIAVVEALASGLPVVVSDGVPLAERIVEAGAGWRCGATAVSLAATLRTALAPTVDLAKVGERGRALAQADYSVEAMGLRLKALYESIVTLQPCASSRTLPTPKPVTRP